MRDDQEEFDESEDGDAETEATVVCPHCSESVEITLDPSGGDQQEYVEDCEICCNPWQVTVHFGADGKAEVEVVALDE